MEPGFPGWDEVDTRTLGMVPMALGTLVMLSENCHQSPT